MPKQESRIVIGCGGWSYYPVNRDRLRAYSQIFSMVELNSSYYKLPSLSQVQRWRTSVPSTFLFSLKGHQSITHASSLELSSRKLATLQRLRTLCQILEAPYLVLQFPPSIHPSDHTYKQLTHLLETIDLGPTQICIEVRNPQWQFPPFRTRLINLVHEHHSLLITDLSRDPPIDHQETQYSRIFGHGQFNRWEFTDDELRTLTEKCKKTESHQVTMVFHSIRMYEAAIRTRYFLTQGHFPKTSSSSHKLTHLLQQYVQYPVSKQVLLDQIGWRRTYTEQHNQTHALTLLENLPETRYKNREEILAQI